MDKARILAIETSSPRLSLAVGTEKKVLKEYNGPLAWRHAESLFGGMKQLLAQVRWPVQTLTGVVVSTGPGSFTGIRIGLAAARALGQALNIPVAGVSSLQAIGYDLLQPGKRVCPMIDALRDEMFTALYEMDLKGRVKTIWKECRLPASEVAEKLKPFSGRSLQVAKGSFPKARVLLELGRDRLYKGKAHYEQVLPLYLRLAAASERRKIQSKT